MEWSWWVASDNACEPGEQLIVLANGDDESDLVGWSLLLLAATVRSFAHMPLGISDRNSMHATFKNHWSMQLNFFATMHWHSEEWYRGRWKFGLEPRYACCYILCVNCWIANKEGQDPRRNFDARFSLSYGKNVCFLDIPYPWFSTWKWRAPQRLWTIRGRVVRTYFMHIDVLHLLYPSLDSGRCVTVGCYNGSRYKMVENHWPRHFSQNSNWRLDPLPTVLLYSVKLLKIHMWVAAKQETVIEGINIINSSATKFFQAHVFTRTGGIIWKTIGKKFWLLHIWFES